MEIELPACCPHSHLLQPVHACVVWEALLRRALSWAARSPRQEISMLPQAPSSREDFPSPGAEAFKHGTPGTWAYGPSPGLPGAVGPSQLPK